MPFSPNPFLPPGLPAAFGLPLARKRVALPESMSALDGRAVFKVRIAWALFVETRSKLGRVFPRSPKKGKPLVFSL